MLSFDSISCPVRLPTTQFDFTDIPPRLANVFREKEALSAQLIFLSSCFTQDFDSVYKSCYFVSSSVHLRKLKRIFLSTFIVVLSGPNYLAKHCQICKFLDYVRWEVNTGLWNKRRKVINKFILVTFCQTLFISRRDTIFKTLTKKENNSLNCVNLVVFAHMLYRIVCFLQTRK